MLLSDVAVTMNAWIVKLVQTEIAPIPVSQTTHAAQLQFVHQRGTAQLAAALLDLRVTHTKDVCQVRPIYFLLYSLNPFTVLFF